MKLDNAVNGYEYVTYNSKKNGEMYLVNIANDAVTAYEVLPTDKRGDEVKALLSRNEDIKWTDKVFVYAPVPSSFKIDAERIIQLSTSNTSLATPSAQPLWHLSMPRNW